MTKIKSKRIVKLILSNLKDRSGVDHALESIDEDIYDEMIEELEDIVEEELKRK